MSAETENENVNPETETDEEAELPANLGDAGKAAIAKERQKAKDAAARAKAAEERAAALEAKQSEADEAKRLADEKVAEEQGQFKELAEKRLEELAAAKATSTAAEAKAEKAIKIITATVDAKWKAAPESVLKLYKGDATDVLAKQEFLDEHDELITELNGKKEEQNDRFRKVPTTPKPNGNGHTTDDDRARKNQARTVSTI